MRNLTMGVLVSVLAPSIAVAESYLCMADAAAGFAYSKETQTWQPVSVKKMDKRYVLKEKDGKWLWTEMGSPAVFPCEGGFSKEGSISCRLVYSFHFSKVTLRYQADMTVATTILERSDPWSNDSPFIEIGRCSSI